MTEVCAQPSREAPQNAPVRSTKLMHADVRDCVVTVT